MSCWYRCAIGFLAGAIVAGCGERDDPDAVVDAGNDADPGHDGAPGIDGTTLSCDFPGSGDWHGTIDGAALATPRSAWVATEADGAWWILGMDEAGGHCFQAGPPGG